MIVRLLLIAKGDNKGGKILVFFSGVFFLAFFCCFYILRFLYYFTLLYYFFVLLTIINIIKTVLSIIYRFSLTANVVWINHDFCVKWKSTATIHSRTLSIPYQIFPILRKLNFFFFVSAMFRRFFAFFSLWKMSCKSETLFLLLF